MIVVVGHGLATSVGDVFPGAPVDVPEAEARRLIARGRAVPADGAAPVVSPPSVVETRDPIIATSRKGKR